jgi:hypothetical protein
VNNKGCKGSNFDRVIKTPDFRLMNALKINLVIFLVTGWMTVSNGQWVSSYTAIPPPVGSTWFEFSFASPDTGYLAHNQFFSVSSGFFYDILTTTDGGISWSTKKCGLGSEEPDEAHLGSPPGSFVLDISAPTRDTVFYTTYGFFNFLRRMIGTGGNQGYIINYGLARDLCAINGQKAFVLVSGISPENISMAVLESDTLQIRYQNDTLRATINSKIHFVNYRTGFLVVNNLGGEALLLKTTNCGLTFAQVTLPLGAVPGVVWFTADSDGFLGCTDGAIYRTSDQGATWQLSLPAMGTKLNAIHFNDSLTGMAVGDGGMALLTTDGGQTWTNHPCYGPLTGVDIFSPTLAYTCNKYSFPVLYKGIYPLAAKEVDREITKLFPNPVRETMMVQLPLDISVPCDYSIYDCLGNVQCAGIIYNRKESVTLPPFSPGLWIFQAGKPGMEIRQRFIKY